MRILLATSELYPYSKTGGLADMVAALGKTLARQGHKVGVVTPLYGPILQKAGELGLERMDWNLTLMLDWRTVQGSVWYLNKDGQDIYFIGQQQAHAMVKLVDRMPTPEEVIQQQQEENCDNLKFICLNDPANIDKLYNSRFTIEQIGQRNKILSGGSYDNYKNDNSAMEVCEYEHWKSCRLTDTVTVNTVLIPWLDVNQKLSYAAKYLKTDLPVEFLIKKIDMTLGDGTMNITLSRYYPYYPYIVDNKYADDGRIRRA